MQFQSTTFTTAIQWQEREDFRASEVLRISTLGYWIMPVWGTLPNGACACNRGHWCQKPGKHTHGQKAATLTTPEAVGAFWQLHPESNYGILHGVHQSAEWVSVCLDFDTYKDANAINAFTSKFGALDWSYFHRSASGGSHLFFKVPKSLFAQWIDGTSRGKKQVYQRAHGIKDVDLLFGSGRNAYSIGPGSVKPSKDKSSFQTYSADPSHALGPVESLPTLPESVVCSVKSYLIARSEKQLAIDSAPMPVQAKLINGLTVSERSALAADWLDGNRVASVQGQNGSKVMFDAMKVLTWGFGLSPTTALPFIEEWNNRFASPRWDKESLMTAANTGWRESVLDSRPMAFMLASGTWAKKGDALKSARASVRRKHSVRSLTSWAIRMLSTGQLTSQVLQNVPARTKGKLLAALRQWATQSGLSLSMTRDGSSNVWSLASGDSTP